MNVFYRLSLRNKIISIILTTVILALTLGFSFSLNQELTSIKNNLLTEKTLTAKIVGSYTTSDLTFNNKETALESLSYLKTDSSIINAHIYDENNEIFISLYKGSPSKTIAPQKAYHEFFENTLLIVEPIYLGSQQIGTLHLLSSTNDYLKTIQKRIKYFIILILSLIILSFLLAGKLSSIVTTPILSLVKAINSFSNGESLNFKINNSHDDETTKLVNSFNKLLVQLKNRENERNEAERSLIETKEHITNILNNMVEGVMTISTNGIIKSVNHTAEEMFGYDECDLLELSITALTNKQQLNKYRGHFNYYIESGELGIIAKGFETVGVRKDKTEFPISVMISEIPNAESNEKLLIVSCENISNKKSQEDQLRRTQRMDALGKLTGGIAHDFNNMLGVMIGYAELIELQAKDSDNLQSYASEILHAGERGKNLTSKLLSFTKRKATEADVTKINSIITQSKNIIEKTLTSRIQLKIKLENNIWDTWLDVGDLEDAIINLSINAMHAMEDGGFLKIETLNIKLDETEAFTLSLPAGDYVELKITDSGTGMPESTLAHIFEPFFTTKKDKGTGLGLSQVYGFVKRSNGEIKVYSEVGRGTHFDFYFPRYVSTKEVLPTLKIEANLEELKGNETILVVDDEEGLRKLAHSLLTLYGYHVLTAQSGKEALSILKNNSVDLLLSDIIMPGMDGYQLSAKVSLHYPKIKIQLASGFSGNLKHKPGSKNQELHNSLLPKPYRKDQLLQRVRSLLDK